MPAVGNLVSEISVAESIFFLIGAGIGVFYGLDGWRGDIKGVEFWKSPRARNFLWVVAGGFSTFVSNFKFLDGVDKSQLLLAYLLGFIFFGTLTVFGWGFLIAVKFAAMKRQHPDDCPKPPFSPFFDYLQYGFEYHRKEYKDALLQKEQDDSHRIRTFLLWYGKKIALAMAAANSSNLTVDGRKDVAIRILNDICDVVSKYSRIPDLEINSNYMIAHHSQSCSADLQGRLRFAFGDHDRYEFYLALEEYAVANGLENFVLPVEKKNSKEGLAMSLPGAPSAFLRNDTVVVDDVKKIKYAKRVPPSIKKELDAYFETKDFCSFASINIIRGGKQLGIVNVQSNQSHVFGRTPEEKKEFSALLYPFCIVLGELIVQSKND